MSDRGAERSDISSSEDEPSGQGSSLTPEQAHLLPFYHDLRNEIVQPDKVVVSTQYFWSKWAPRLGPTLTALVICLRRHCYYNRATQERRDWCFPEQATLAREIGVETTKTVRAALQHPLIVYFVRREPRYVYDPTRGKKVRTSDMYYVAMDDPLIPEDESLLAVRAAVRLVSEGRASENLTLTPSPTPPRPKSKKDRQVTPRRTGSPDGQKDFQIVGPTGHFARQDSSVILTPEDVPLTSTTTTTREAADPIARLVSAYSAANAVVPTPAQIARLRSLCEQYEAPARRSFPPGSGADWILAAIEEAVESGSQFVAPRRIARICDRWVADGGPAVTGGSGPTKPPPSQPPARESTPRQGPPSASQAQPTAGFDENQGLLLEPDQGAATPLQVPSFNVFPELGLPSRPFWQTVCDEARRRLGGSPDAGLVVGSVLLARQGNVLTVGMPGRAAAERAHLRLTQTLEDVSRSIVGRSVEFRFIGYGEWGGGEQRGS